MEYLIYGIIIITVLAFVYFPRKAQEKQIKNMQQDLKLGDEVVTFYGIKGKIKEISEDEIILQVAPNDILLTIEKWSVAQIKK